MNLPREFLALPLALLLAAAHRAPATTPGAPVDTPADPVRDLAAAAAGCSADPAAAPGAPDWVHFLNGELQSQADVQAAARGGDVHLAHVICNQAVERLYGVSVRHGAWNVFTRPGPLDGFDEALAALPRHQARHYERFRSYTSDVAALQGFQVPPHTTVALRGTAAGWTATVRHAMVPRVCHVYGGAVAKPRAGMEQGQPKCFSEDPHP